MKYFILLVLLTLMACSPDPINMTDAEIADAYKYVRASDHRIVGVSISKNLSTLIFTRADIGLNLDVVAKSWCNEFPELKFVQIRNLSSKKLLGGASCSK